MARRPLSSPVALALPLAAATLVPCSPATAQLVDRDLWITDGVVNTVVESDGTLYLGGVFSRVAPGTGGIAALDPSTAELLPSFPKVAGRVYVVAPDGAGGWYLGGAFSHVNGLPRSNLAHLQPDFSVSAWDPGTGGAVHALAAEGSTVYAGGSFTTAGGTTRNRLAAIDASTGVLTNWDPDVTGSLSVAVYALVVDGSTVYSGGKFNAVGGHARNNIAAIDAVTATPTAWTPNANLEVRALAVSGSLVYAGGDFTQIGGQLRGLVAALDASTGLATSWNPNGSDGAAAAVYTLVVDGSTVYVGGRFTSMGGPFRSNIAALDAATGSATTWNPSADGEVRALATSGSTVYAGGSFGTIGALPRQRVAALDATTGIATGWNPGPFQLEGTAVAHAVAVSGSTVLVGGGFSGCGGVERSNLAALDAVSGEAAAWNPGAGGTVDALAVSGATVFVGGGFTQIGGQPRNRIAAVDATTGAVSGWNPDADDDVTALLLSGSTLWASGAFRQIAGQPRNFVAQLDVTTGTATPWNARILGGNGNRIVHALAVSGSTLYLAGDFSFLAQGESFAGLAAFDTVTGDLPTWIPPAPQPHPVRALLLGGSTLYLGGDFTLLGTQPRNHLAALDLAGGAVTAWDPDAGGSVHALTGIGSTVYVGGEFLTIGGQSRGRLAAVHATSGDVAPWNPGADSPGGYAATVIDLTAHGSTVYAGGAFHTVGGWPQARIAALGAGPTDAPRIPGAVASLRLDNAPNPFGLATAIRFVLPNAGRVRLDVFDVAGRRVATPLHDTWLGTGVHRLDFASGDLRSGVYFYRLQASDVSRTRKMILLR